MQVKLRATHTHTVKTCDSLQFNETYVSCTLQYLKMSTEHTHRNIFSLTQMYNLLGTPQCMADIAAVFLLQATLF